MLLGEAYYSVQETLTAPRAGYMTGTKKRPHPLARTLPADLGTQACCAPPNALVMFDAEFNRPLPLLKSLAHENLQN